MAHLDNLMISVSGVRGIVGDGLTPQVAMLFAQAFGSEFGPGKIVVGRDSRVTGDMLKFAVWSGLMSVGCDVLDIGMVSTPTTAMATENQEHAGGIILTASHNPKQWNALKLLGSDGMFLRPEQGDRVLERVVNNNIHFAEWDKLGKIFQFSKASEEHVFSILKLPILNKNQIKSRKFNIVVDCCNGAGATILPFLFENLGCTVFYLNKEPHGLFPRNPEPTPDNLTELCTAVKNYKADLGFAVDPDVDRLALVSEKGVPLGEEYTLALVAKFILSKTKGDIVVNMSTTRAIDDIALETNSRIFRTKVGEIHVATKAQKIGAIIAGEGNGGVIYPDLHLGRDAPVGIALVLQYLAETQKSLSELCAQIPQYVMIKDKIELSFGVDAKGLVTKLSEKSKQENINTLDGLKLIFQDSWIHIRASNTEPIIRVIAEAPTREQAGQLIQHFKKELDNL